MYGVEDLVWLGWRFLPMLLFFEIVFLCPFNEALKALYSSIELYFLAVRCQDYTLLCYFMCSLPWQDSLDRGPGV